MGFMPLFTLIALVVLLLVVVPLLIIENDNSKKVLGFYYNEEKKWIEKPFWIYPLYSTFFIFFQLSLAYYFFLEYQSVTYNIMDYPFDLGIFLLMLFTVTIPIIKKTIKEYKMLKKH